MANTLHEMAVKLQEFIIRQQEDAHNSGSLNVAKYNNLKLTMDPAVSYPHIIIRIGISEGIYNLNDSSRTDGSLGPDERYVRRWLASIIVVNDLMDIYKMMEEESKAGDTEGQEITQGKKGKKTKRTKIIGVGNVSASIAQPKRLQNFANRREIRQDIRSILDSSTRNMNKFFPTEAPSDDN